MIFGQGRDVGPALNQVVRVESVLGTASPLSLQRAMLELSVDSPSAVALFFQSGGRRQSDEGQGVRDLMNCQS